PFDTGHAADPADDEAVGRDPEQPACLGAVSVRTDTAVELDAEPDDRELLRRRDAEPDEVVPHLRADGDERSRPPGEPALEQAEETGAQRPEVAAQDVAVEC